MTNPKDVLAGAAGSVKALAARVPVVGEMLAGWDCYRSARFEREATEFLERLSTTLGQVGERFDASWFATPEGEKFARKVLDCAIDAQLADKKELFANALVNGALDMRTSPLDKLKFVDILRHMSRASLMVLADVHDILGPDVRGPGRIPVPNKPYPLLEPERIAERLSPKYDPYLVESTLKEMESQGLFSSTAEWKQQADGSSQPGGGFMNGLAYTDFTCRFVEFITSPEESSQT